LISKRHALLNFLTVAKRKNARNPFKSIYLLKETILVPMPRYLSNLMDLRGRSENQINLGLFQTLAVVLDLDAICRFKD
jgi:hypothetical protein